MDLIIYHRIPEEVSYFLVPKKDVDTVRAELERVSTRVYNNSVDPFVEDYWSDFDVVDSSISEWDKYKASPESVCDYENHEAIKVYTITLII